MTQLASRSSVSPAQMVALDRPAPSAKSIMQIMEGQQERLAACATKHLTPEKLIRMIGVQMQRVPKLGHCTPISVLECAMTLSELGLSPGVLGDAYLIPYKETCTVIVGYRGLLKLARRSGEISTVQAEVVREGDEFQWRFGMDAALNHVPGPDIKGKMTHAWAMAKFRDGSFQFVVMRAVEVEEIRKRSKASGNGPWVTDTGEMWKKTALRRLCKMLPLTPEVEQAIAVADKTEFDFEDLGMLPPGERERPTAGSIADKLEGRTADEGGGDDDQTEPAGPPDECSTANPECSQSLEDYSTDGDGKRRCAKHAQSGGESSTPDAKDGALPGMDSATQTTRKRR